VRLDTGAVVGFESLLRWNHPDRGVLTPDAFLAIAEASGSLEVIDWQMFDLTCAAVSRLVRPGQYVNLNFSPRHFRDKQMDQRLLSLLRDHGVSPSQVRIEVTEGTFHYVGNYAAGVQVWVIAHSGWTTADFYAMGHNELLIREALRGRRRDDVVLSVKFGALRGPTGEWGGVDTRPVAVRNFVAYSLRRLGVEHIDIYRPARLDPAVPIEDTVGAIAELVQAGYVRHVGLSEVGAATIRRAHAVHPVADVQLEYSLISRGIEEKILPAVRELGIGVTAYGVLSRGLLSGHWSTARPLRGGDFRTHGPRFQPGNVERNLALVDALRAVAVRRGATVAQVAIAWVLARGRDILPVIGARRPDRLAEALDALDLALTEADLATVDGILAPVK